MPVISVQATIREIIAKFNIPIWKRNHQLLQYRQLIVIKADFAAPTS